MLIKRFPTLPAALLCAAALACALTDTTPLTAAAPSAETMAPVIVDVTITSPPLNAVIPEALAGSATSAVSTEVEYPYINPSLGEMPAHTKYVLEDYLLVGSIQSPQVVVFNAAEYAAYSELNQTTIDQLQSYYPNTTTGLQEGFPEGMISAQIRPISFQNGRGLRYLTQAGQAATPINNRSLFYFFQGITDDGKFFVSAILPTSAPYLIADENPNSPLPVDGIPFEFENYDALPSYILAIEQKINSSSANVFTPSIEVLDSFIQSFLIQAS